MQSLYLLHKKTATSRKHTSQCWVCCVLTDCGKWDHPLAAWPCKWKKSSACSVCSWRGLAITNSGLALQILLCKIPCVSKARDKGIGSRNIPLAGHCIGLHGFLDLSLRDAQEEEMAQDRTTISGKLPISLPHRAGFSYIWWC